MCGVPGGVLDETKISSLVAATRLFVPPNLIVVAAAIVVVVALAGQGRKEGRKEGREVNCEQITRERRVGRGRSRAATPLVKLLA